MKDLQVMQNKAAQIISHSPPRAHRSTMYDNLQWLTVNQLIFYHSAITVFKIRENREPEHLAEILCQDNRNRRIIIPNLDLRLAQKSFSMRAAENWNQIPLEIRSQSKVGNFKKLAKRWILDNVPKFLE